MTYLCANLVRSSAQYNWPVLVVVVYRCCPRNHIIFFPSSLALMQVSFKPLRPAKTPLRNIKRVQSKIYLLQIRVHYQDAPLNISLPSHQPNF